MSEILILPEVLGDIAEAAAWYDKEAYPGLGDRFIDTFYASLNAIPVSGPSIRKIHGDFRKLWLKPFPYAVFFRHYRALWVVTLVIHGSRRPQLTLDLLGERT